MRVHLVTTIILSQFLNVASFTTLDRYYERLTREAPQSFHPLNQVQFLEDDTHFPDEPNSGSLRFMVAPVQISNPLFNFISKAGQLYSALFQRRRYENARETA